MRFRGWFLLFKNVRWAKEYFLLMREASSLEYESSFQEGVYIEMVSLPSVHPQNPGSPPCHPTQARLVGGSLQGLNVGVLFESEPASGKNRSNNL